MRPAAALDASRLKLPTHEDLDVKPEVLEKVKIKLRIEFSIVSIKRDDPNG